MEIIVLVIIFIGGGYWAYWAIKKQETVNQTKLQTKQQIIEKEKFYNDLNSLYNAGKYDEIVKKIDLKTEQNETALLMAGVSYVELGNVEMAEKVFNLNIEKNTYSINKGYNLITAGKIFYKHGHYKKALQFLQKVDFDKSLEKYNGYFQESILWQGKSQIKMEMIDLALTTFKRANFRRKEVDDVTKEILYEMAWCYEQKDDKKNAFKYYDKVASIDIDYKDVLVKIQDLNK